MTIKRSWFLLLSMLLAGCTSTITNLTPRTVARNSSGYYPFEVAWDSNQQSLRERSLQPSVIIGLKAFPMQPTALVKNRWETLIPISPEDTFVNYHYKFDYTYNSIPQPKKSSRRSTEYVLQITNAPAPIAPAP